MPRAKHYVLTPTARQHLREARAWSRARWGEERTRAYFVALHEAADDLAKNYTRYRQREELAGGTGLRIYPVREHYFVYEPLGEGKIVIVAVLRQGRDIPTVLSKGKHVIMRELRAMRKKGPSA